MKFTIKINQKSIIENKLNLDLIDAVLLDFMMEFSRSDAIVSIEENGVKFFWFSHGKILEEIPMLGLKRDSVFRRLKRLCEKGFLIQSNKSQSLGRSFYAFTKLSAGFGFISEGSDLIPKVTQKAKAPERRPKQPKKTEDPPEEIPTDKDIIDKTLFPEGNIDSGSIYKKAVEIYFNFYRELNEVDPKFDGADGKALKSMIAYFTKNHKEKVKNGKSGETLEESVLKSLKYIFDNWDVQVDFIRNQTRMININSNLNNIINKLKNAKSKSTSGNSDKGSSGVRKIAKFTAEEFGIPSDNSSE